MKAGVSGEWWKTHKATKKSKSFLITTVLALNPSYDIMQEKPKHALPYK